MQAGNLQHKAVTGHPAGGLGVGVSCLLHLLATVCSLCTPKRATCTHQTCTLSCAVDTSSHTLSPVPHTAGVQLAHTACQEHWGPGGAHAQHWDLYLVGARRELSPRAVPVGARLSRSQLEVRLAVHIPGPPGCRGQHNHALLLY